MKRIVVGEHGVGRDADEEVGKGLLRKVLTRILWRLDFLLMHHPNAALRGLACLKDHFL